ncbi:hypothetical protein AZF37_03145 [endosymbiont 'TC1' of Trimyema compressum]|uniref:hypothetical protein n=1 Tax=endosymbiont 'TC1' of Trimyema compressum TaxID=243899 RepID=UPI0007F0ABE9|nr:hypothetical protein [endosymbiont 'TC1' of Trimyema compressum]AMP20296.1 hypothetical protein AZF37_03145 [endosymbiont 'TC1' of Trimyema compressum]
MEKLPEVQLHMELLRVLNIKETLKVTGVVKILTPDDVPNIAFATAGHPYVLDSNSADVADRNILTKNSLIWR